MSEKQHVKRGFLKSRRSRLLFGILTSIAILAIVIPPAVVVTLRKKGNDMGPKSSVFVPLYVYPAPDAWTPLQNVYVLAPCALLPMAQHSTPRGLRFLSAIPDLNSEEGPSWSLPPVYPHTWLQSLQQIRPTS